MTERTTALPVTAGTPLPQPVPSERCLRCDVCCRFPERTSPLRPYFSREEIDRAVAQGISPAAFPDSAGSRIDLIPHPAGDGFICPAFDVTTSRCMIYDVRPLDCRLYPFALMRPPQGDGLLLGWDRLCPYLREEADAMLPIALAPEIARHLDAAAIVDEHPALVGAFQDAVWVLEPLTPAWTPGAADRSAGLRPIDDGDVRRLRVFLERSVESDSSARHPAAWLMWRPLMNFFWLELDRGRAVVAEQGGGYFAPVPPVANRGESFPALCADLLAQLGRLNGGHGAARIERMSDAQRPIIESTGLRCRAQGEEYLYDRRALAELRGDDYKSARWNCNQAARRFHPSYEPYRPADLIECLRLCAAWRRLKERRPSADGYAAALLADSFYAHWQALAHAADWGLRARVVRIGGEIKGYTVGAPLNEWTMAVLHEVADPRCPGVGAWLFREWCREFSEYAVINAMDDSDLPALRAAKTRYRPMRRLPFYLAVLAPE